MKINVRSFIAASIAAIALVACASGHLDEIRRVQAVGIHFSPWDRTGAPDMTPHEPVTGGDVIHPDNAKLAQAFDARALLREGETLARQREYDQAIARFDEIDARFGQSDDPAIKRAVARALFTKGNVMAWRGVPEEERNVALDAALEVQNTLDRRFGKDGDPLINEQIAKSLSDKTAIYVRRRQPERAVSVANELERRFGAEDSPIFREAKLVALSNKGAALGMQSRYGEAIAQFDELESRYGAENRPAMLELLDMARHARKVVEGNRPQTN
ncbi:MAG: hypothetical protein LBR05_01325 [Azoarcus sp.]|jgi:tetratricopeptide (TPR) repeat protein|nr:hypothetical protein [Azoarcus sp.]